MAVDNRLEVVGIKEALAELNDLDKKFRRGITVRYKEIVQPMLQEAKALTPKKPPMSGWAREWSPTSERGYRAGEKTMETLPWTGQEARFIRPFVSGKRPKQYGGVTRHLTTFGVRWTSPTAILFDQSSQFKTPQGRQMVSVLSRRFGAPSRVMWRAYMQAEWEIQGNMRDLINDIMERVNRDIRV